MRYSQGNGDDFKQILDANFDEMMKDGVVFGQEGTQNCLEFLGPRRQDSFTSFNLLSGSYSFGQASQKGGDENEAGAGRKRDNKSLQALLGEQDELLSLEEADARTLARLKAEKDKKTLKKLTQTRSKHDLFFDFMVDLFSMDGQGEQVGSTGNKFLQRALHSTALQADQGQDYNLQLLNDESGKIYQSALKERSLIDSIMPSSNKQALLSAEQMRNAQASEQ